MTEDRIDMTSRYMINIKESGQWIVVLGEEKRERKKRRNGTNGMLGTLLTKNRSRLICKAEVANKRLSDTL